MSIRAWDDGKPRWKWDEPTRAEAAIKAEREAAAAWERVCRHVDVRDQWSCRACHAAADPKALGLSKRGERHHIRYRSAGGQDTADNVCLLCPGCHADEHRHRLRITGNAEEALTFERKTPAGEWYTWREEIRVRQFRKD